MSDKINQAVWKWEWESDKSGYSYVQSSNNYVNVDIRRKLYDPIVERLVFSQPNRVLDAINSANKPEIFLRNYRPPFVSMVFSLNNTLIGRVSFEE